MSEFEKKAIDEMDAADVVAAAQEADRKRMVPVEVREEGETEGRTEEWSGKITVEVGGEVKWWAKRQKRDACALALLSNATWFACAAALMTGIWEPVVLGIALVNLMMTGAWMHKAKVG